ncbi:tetratricopeptide repeat protein [Altererythrobacter soli]|uniref:Tetratricopeptide repeat protein n=1 Tax=Croceibacterium soli TaxID=1739690 RepID=A0A6I4UU99_9SPHN|nr:tetratricopeptide repeat-containing sulfotransferase family protein [Croceibacterium soli]MXP40695.1 tetratricopeptide repeat protein [Croceibacterium soli]
MTAQSPSKLDGPPPFERAVIAARQGDFLLARELAAASLDAGPENAVAHHAFLGMVCARSGDLEAATENLLRAHALRPDDVTIACNLISILMDAGLDGQALTVASEDLAKADPSLRVARLRGFLAQKLEDFAAAVAAYRLVLDSAPDDFECLNNLGNALVATGDYAGAVDVLRRAVSLDPRAAPTRLNLASALLALDRTDEAEVELVRASADFPADWRPPHQLYVFYKAQQRQEEAMAALLEAAAREPNSASVQLKLGIEHGIARETEEAERAYRRTIDLDPSEADAYVGLAIQFEHTNREDQFAPLIALGRKNGIAAKSLAFIEALELRRQKRFADALVKLDEVPADVEPVRTTHMRATLLDRLGRTDEAFAAFATANALLEDTPNDPLGRAAELRRQLEAEIAQITPAWRAGWIDVAVDDGRPDPAFLVGFPRSGTTLLDTILMGHPGTAVMEEQPPLNRVEEKLGGLTALPGMSADQITDARACYFAEVDKIQPVGPGQLLIDKSPLFLYRLPLIRRLFPKAKVILALRHPCDVVLSCLMSNFRLNPAMANFLRPEDAAGFYDLSFTHWTKSHELFPDNVFSLKYEDLVDDVEGQVQPLVEWLGLEWDPAVLDHTRTARSRGLITTASYSQVVEPIYRRASGRWLRYRAHLEQVLPKLAPWVDELGYDPV